jgi:heptosyltransferase II
MTSDPARLVVRMPNWLGDAVMALPAVAEVRSAWPSATLAVAAPSGLAPLFHERTSAAPDEVVSLESGGEVAALAAGRFDAILLLPNSVGSAWIARRAGIPERWGYAGGVRRWLLTRSAARPRGRVHQAAYYRELVRRVAAPAVGAVGDAVEVDAADATAGAVVRVCDETAQRAARLLER